MLTGGPRSRPRSSQPARLRRGAKLAIVSKKNHVLGIILRPQQQGSRKVNSIQRADYRGKWSSGALKDAVEDGQNFDLADP